MHENTTYVHSLTPGVSLMSAAVREVTFRNSGTKAGTFSITLDEGVPVKLRPRHALLEPGHHTTVQIDVQGKELGPLR